MAGILVSEPDLLTLYVIHPYTDDSMPEKNTHILFQVRFMGSFYEDPRFHLPLRSCRKLPLLGVLRDRLGRLVGLRRLGCIQRSALLRFGMQWENRTVFLHNM
jgi:hypothetical protein